MTTTIKLTQEMLDAAKTQLQRVHETHRTEQRAAFEIQSESAWVKSESDRKAKWIAGYRYETDFKPAPWPYKDYSAEDLYRVSLDASTRLEELIRAGLWDQALRVWLFRHEPSCRATLQETVDFLRPFIPVAGDYKITTSRTYKHQVLNGPVRRSMEAERTDEFIEASNLSKELYALLTGWCISVERGHVVWSEGRREYIRREEY